MSKSLIILFLLCIGKLDMFFFLFFFFFCFVCVQIAKDAYKSWQDMDYSCLQQEVRWYISIGSGYLNLLRTCFVDVNPAQTVTDVHTVFTWERMVPRLPAASSETRRAVAYFHTKDGFEFQQLNIDELMEFCLTLLGHLSVQVATDVELNSFATNALEVIHDLIQ
jgi:hypothetical protein